LSRKGEDRARNQTQLHRSAAVLTIGLYHPRAYSGDGGITRSVRSLSAALLELGYPNRVIFDGEGAPDENDSWVGVPHFKAGPIHVPVGIKQSIEDLSVLVLHSAWVPYNVAAAQKAQHAGVPYVLAPRGAYEPGILDRRPAAKTAWWHVFEKRLIDNAAAIHVFFESQADQLRNLGYDGPLVVAPNGVHVPEDLRWDGGSSDALVFVGRFDMEHKGIGVLLQALSTMPRSSRPRVILYGPDWRGGKDEAREEIRRLGLASWVDVRPPIYGRTKFEIMAAARGFLYPSLFEAFGNSAAEAAALGVPVLTGEYPLGQYLDDHDAGIAVPGEPDAIAEGLEMLLQPSAGRLGANAVKAMTPFSWTAVGEAWGSQLLALEPVSA
jgi:glycosyltransferase involved in cell wall biosynthesis